MIRIHRGFLLVGINLAACAADAPVPPQSIAQSTPAQTAIRIVGEGGSIDGAMTEASYASATGGCVSSTTLRFGADGFQVGGQFDELTLTAPLPNESDADAHLRSRIWRSDGSSGVVVNGSIALDEQPSGGYLLSLIGDTWCGVSPSDALINCAAESTEATFSIEYLSNHVAPDCVLEADASITQDGACMAAAQPWRCVGDPIPPDQD